MTVPTSDIGNDAATVWLAYNEAENRQDLVRTAELVAQSLIVLVNDVPALGSAAEDAVAMADLLALYPDYQRHVDEVIAAGERATVRWRMQGRDRNGGPPLNVAGCSVITTKAGRITHAYLYCDGVALEAALQAGGR